MQFILWGQIWTRHEEFEILVYTRYKNGISHVHHLSISTNHVSVFRTEPIDGIHYECHASMPGVPLVVGTGSPWSPAPLSCGGGGSVVLLTAEEAGSAVSLALTAV